MSLYRVASRRSRLFGLLVPAIALVVGLVVGLLVGRATAPEPSLSDVLADEASHVAEARTALDVLTIEYPQAVSSPTEYGGAQADVRHAQDALAAAGDLEALDPSGYRRATALVAEVAALVARKAPPAEVEARVRSAEEALAALPGAGSDSG
jgi:hypothetical protein